MKAKEGPVMYTGRQTGRHVVRQIGQKFCSQVGKEFISISWALLKQIKNKILNRGEKSDKDL